MLTITYSPQFREPNLKLLSDVFPVNLIYHRPSIHNNDKISLIY